MSDKTIYRDAFGFIISKEEYESFPSTLAERKAAQLKREQEEAKLKEERAKIEELRKEEEAQKIKDAQFKLDEEERLRILNSQNTLDHLPMEKMLIPRLWENIKSGRAIGSGTGDEPMDAFLTKLDEKGFFVIYDRNGKLVKTFISPESAADYVVEHPGSKFKYRPPEKTLSQKQKASLTIPGKEYYEIIDLDGTVIDRKKSRVQAHNIAWKLGVTIRRVIK